MRSRDVRSIRALGVAFLTVLLAACGGSGGSPTAAPPPAAAPTVGPAGGTVASASGGARLVIPQGALSAAVALVLRSSNAGPLDPHAVGSTTVAIEPAGTTFSIPVTLSIRYDPGLGPSGVDESDLRIHVLPGGEWQAVAGAATDRGTHEASASITAAGTFAVRWTGPRDACASDDDREFDFWLGRWDFHQGNLPLASNEITKEGNGCLLEEHFQDPLGGRGRSVSLFSRLDGRWHQTYIDSGGQRLVLVGGLERGRMVLNRTATERFTWDPVDTATVRYFGERSADGGASWTVNFDARYTRH